MKRIKLLRSQKILLQMKNEKIQEAIGLAQARQKEFQATLNLTMTEQGVPKDELPSWRLTEDMQAIEKFEPENPNKNKNDKKSDRKNKDKKEK